MNSMKSMVGALVMCLIASAAVYGTDLKLDNASNEDIHVAVAYRNWNGNIGIAGWWVIKSNESMSFYAPDAAEMYIHVSKNGSEVVFQNHNIFSSWPVHPTDRFEISKSPLNPQVNVFRWGANLQYDHNIICGNPFPAAFELRRFFRVGNGTQRLDLLPR